MGKKTIVGIDYAAVEMRLMAHQEEMLDEPEPPLYVGTLSGRMSGIASNIPIRPREPKSEPITGKKKKKKKSIGKRLTSKPIRKGATVKGGGDNETDPS